MNYSTMRYSGLEKDMSWLLCFLGGVYIWFLKSDADEKFIENYVSPKPIKPKSEANHESWDFEMQNHLIKLNTTQDDHLLEYAAYHLFICYICVKT